MTTQKVKTETFYIEENTFLEGTRQRLNKDLDKQTATLREHEMRWAALTEKQRDQVPGMKPSTFKKSKVRTAAAEAASSTDRRVTFSGVPTPPPHQTLNWNTQGSNGGARDPAIIDPYGERTSPSYRRNLHAKGFNVDKAIVDIRSQFKFKQFATLRVVRGATGWDVFLKTNVGEKVHLRCDCYGLKNSSDASYMTNEEKMANMEMHVCQFCVDNSRDNYDYPTPYDLAWSPQQ